MNIFFTDSDPKIAARNQCDKLLIKMILETAQMLSTAHRMLDGTRELIVVNGRKRQIWTHPDARLYKATHWNHPSSVWIRTNDSNYKWAYEHFLEMCYEYEYRFGKKHKTGVLLSCSLFHAPFNISAGKQTPFVKCMGASPESLAIADPVEAYRHFYQTKQTRFKMTWTKRKQPDWFKHL